MPTVIGKTAYTHLEAQIGRLKSTQGKREKKIASLEKKLKGLKPVDLRHERRKRKSRKRSRR